MFQHFELNAVFRFPFVTGQVDLFRSIMRLLVQRLQHLLVVPDRQAVVA